MRTDRHINIHAEVLPVQARLSGTEEPPTASRAGQGTTTFPASTLVVGRLAKRGRQQKKGCGQKHRETLKENKVNHEFENDRHSQEVKYRLTALVSAN